MLQVFYDLELSEKTITQLGAVCHLGTFNRFTIPEGGFRYHDGTTKYCTKVTDRIDPSDGRQKLFHTVKKVFLPTVSSKEGFRDFLAWLVRMREASGASSLSLLCWGIKDHDHLVKNIEATEAGLREELMETLGPLGRMVDAQMMVKVIAKPAKTNLGFVFKELLPEEAAFSEHDAEEDARATYRVYERVKEVHGLDDAFMMTKSLVFDPCRDQIVKHILDGVLLEVLLDPQLGWLDKAVEQAVTQLHSTKGSQFLSRSLNDAVLKHQDGLRLLEAEKMLLELKFEREKVDRICLNPLEGLKTLVEDLKVISSPETKFKDRSVKASSHRKTVFRKTASLEEAEKDVGSALLWQLLTAGEVRGVLAK